MNCIHKTLRVILFLTAAAFSVSYACAKQSRIVRPDCGLSFAVPNEFEYIEVEKPQLADGISCVIAFRRRGSSVAAESVGLPEGWREQVDHVLEVKASPLQAGLSAHSLVLETNGKYKLAPASGATKAIGFKLTSVKSLHVQSGAGLIVDMEAIHRPRSMVANGVEGQVLLIAGNKQRYVDYVLWPTPKNTYSTSDLSAMTGLFESIELITSH